MQFIGIDRAAINDIIEDVVDQGSRVLKLRLVTWLRPKAQTPENGLVMLLQYNDLARTLKETCKSLKRMDDRLKKVEELTSMHCSQTQYVEKCYWSKNQDVNSLIPRQTRQEPMHQEVGAPLIDYPLQPYKKEHIAVTKAGAAGKGKRR